MKPTATRVADANRQIVDVVRREDRQLLIVIASVDDLHHSVSDPVGRLARAELVEDEDFGQRLRAYVALRGGRDVSEQELKDHVKANLARYKVPREVVFVDELPRNATGKVLKRDLAESSP